MTSTSPQTPTRPKIAVLSFAALTIAYSLANYAAPHRDSWPPEFLDYAQEHGTAINVGSFLTLAAAVSLAVASAVFYRGLRERGAGTAGPAVALVGGALASSCLVLDAMFFWAGGRLPGDADPFLARALSDLSFLSGGIAYAAMFGLFAAGLAMAGRHDHVLPRFLVWVGLLIGLVAALSTLTLLGDVFRYLLPVVRFGGLVWLLFAAAEFKSESE